MLPGMYVPAAFKLDDERVYEVMRRHSFALVVTMGRDKGGEGSLRGTHVPVVVRGKETLEFHLARANPQCQDLASGAEAMAVFGGPHTYISPAWYADRMKAVPTWNYVAVHVYGRARVLDEQGLHAHLAELVRVNEAATGTGWSFAEADEGYVAGLSRGVVGFALSISRIEGKAKMSETKKSDRRSVVKGLRSTGKVHDAEVADWMEADMGRAIRKAGETGGQP